MCVKKIFSQIIYVNEYWKFAKIDRGNDVFMIGFLCGEGIRTAVDVNLAIDSCR